MCGVILPQKHNWLAIRIKRTTIITIILRTGFDVRYVQLWTTEPTWETSLYWTTTTLDYFEYKYKPWAYNGKDFFLIIWQGGQNTVIFRGLMWVPRGVNAILLASWSEYPLVLILALVSVFLSACDHVNSLAAKSRWQKFCLQIFIKCSVQAVSCWEFKDYRANSADLDEVAHCDCTDCIDCIDPYCIDYSSCITHLYVLDICIMVD